MTMRQGVPEPHRGDMVAAKTGWKVADLHPRFTGTHLGDQSEKSRIVRYSAGPMLTRFVARCRRRGFCLVFVVRRPV